MTSNTLGHYFGDPFSSRCSPSWSGARYRCSCTRRTAAHRLLGFGRPSSIVEFPFDTARTITNGLYTGLFKRLPRLRLILAHCGGALPTLGWRIGEHTVMGRGTPGRRHRPGHVAGVLRGLYYETALAGSRNSLLPTLE